ncbi:PBSX family phage terminase large subunit [Pseudomonas sp.]|uniref:PBSX family phage terminase large subunit n=1 Tax=Pseudomonas sp. TaxID=306 RepID=UPI002FC7950B
MTTARLEVPPKLIPVFTGNFRYRGSYGGRGSAKTRTFAKMTAVRAMMFAQAGVSGVVLCGREFMNSLEDSSMEEIKQAIRETPWLDAFFDIGEKFIRTKDRRVSYVFCGLRHNLDSIKSKARILIAWIDEAESVSEMAWSKLLPTVRAENSEVWITWNPEDEESPTNQRFRMQVPENACIVEMNYSDNPWFPDVLEQERLNDYNRMDGPTYSWVWEGAYRKNSLAQIFAGKYEVKEFTHGDDWDGPYNGLDFGFSQDPTAATQCWIQGETLYVEFEAGKAGLELDHTADYICKRIPGFDREVVRADSARPESISYLKRPDLDGKRKNTPGIIGVEKGKGSVEDGIEFIKSFALVVIHPRCQETAREFQRYSYKVDRLSGDVTKVILDKFNHYIDSIRYGLEQVMKSRGRMKISEKAKARAMRYPMGRR